jgi:hypothetical protein
MFNRGTTQTDVLNAGERGRIGKHLLVDLLIVLVVAVDTR